MLEWKRAKAFDRTTEMSTEEGSPKCEFAKGLREREERSNPYTREREVKTCQAQSPRHAGMEDSCKIKVKMLEYRYGKMGIPVKKVVNCETQI